MKKVLALCGIMFCLSFEVQGSETAAAVSAGADSSGSDASGDTPDPSLVDPGGIKARTETLPHLPSDSSTLNNLKQLFFKSKELKDKASKYRKLVEELRKRETICEKLAEQAERESERIDQYIHSQLQQHEKVVETIKAQTVKKYDMNRAENSNVERFLSEVVRQHDDYKKTPEYKAKVNEYIKMMEEAKVEAERKKKSLEGINHSPAPDPGALF